MLRSLPPRSGVDAHRAPVLPLRTAEEMSMRATPFSRFVTTLRAAAGAFGLLLALSAAAQVPVDQSKGLGGLGFTYQGQLRNAGTLVNGICDFQFALWDAADLGNQLGMAQEVPAVGVAGGQFTVFLNEGGQFGPTALNGHARWLSIGVRCGAEPAFTALSPRQPVTASPYAFALPGVVPGLFPSAASSNLAGNFSLA